MRIGFVYDAVYPWETGGVQKRVWEVGRRLATDHDVHWYGLHYWDGPAVIERDGVTLHGVGEPQTLYVDGRRSIAEALTYSASLVEPLLRADLDVVDCQEFPYFSCLPSKLGTALDDALLAMTWHEVWDDYWLEYLGWKGHVGRLVERGVARLPDTHLSVSKRTRDDLATLGVSESRVVPNGIDTEEIAAAEPAADAVDVLFVGRFIEEKQPDLVVRAVADLVEANPDVRCVLVGDGPERERVEALVAEVGLERNVRVQSPLEEYEDVLGLMKAADAFVLPSRREGFGMVALEALACGTPVVTIDHPQNAASELVTDGETGRVVASTPSAVAAGIRDVRTSTSAAACTATAQRYDWDRIVDELETTYREAR